MPRAVAQASEVLIDSMRSLLELHYDEVHTADWVRTHATKRVPARESEYKIFHKVAQLQRQRPNQQLSLPASVKNILRKPSDELQWARLEMLRSVVQQELEGERDFVLNQEEIEQLARSIAACRSKQFPDEVAAGSVVPEGSRVCLGQDVVASRVTARRRYVASAVRGLSDRVRVMTRPRGTCSVVPAGHHPWTSSAAPFSRTRSRLSSSRKSRVCQ